MIPRSNHQAGRIRRRATLVGLATSALIAIPATGAAASDGGISVGGGGATVPGDKAKLVDGKAIPPESAPRKVKRAIRAANEIVKGKDYCLGGGHRTWHDNCYDCSGTVSYALGRPGARLIDAPMPSGSFTSWGRSGRGRWITVYPDSGHVFAVIAGLRLDTSQTPGKGPGWSENIRAGFANVSRTAALHWR